MATKTRKPTTAADIAAAVKLGTIAPDTEVLSAADAAAMTAAAAKADSVIAADPGLSASEHGCGIPGCRHGASHPEHSQPDRQVKLACPQCGAVARMTQGALARTQGKGIVCGLDGSTFAVAARRTYSRKA